MNQTTVDIYEWVDKLSEGDFIDDMDGSIPIERVNERLKKRGLVIQRSVRHFGYEVASRLLVFADKKRREAIESLIEAETICREHDRAFNTEDIIRHIDSRCSENMEGENKDANI